MFKARLDGALSNLGEGTSAHGRGFGTMWSLRSLPTQTILWYCGSINPMYNGTDKAKLSEPLNKTHVPLSWQRYGLFAHICRSSEAS